MIKCSHIIAGGGLAFAALSASALSLGESRGAVVLGAPVDLAFQVRSEERDDAAPPCLQVRLVEGDTPVPSARLRVTPLQGGWVRVQTTSRAQEPVLVATVTAGCTGVVTRSYTFLAQLPESAPVTSAPLDLVRLSARRAPAAAQTPEPTAARSGRRAAPSGAQEDAARPSAAARKRLWPAAKPDYDAGDAPPAAARSARRARPQPDAAPVARANPRLVMEPLDVWLDAPLPLRASGELAHTPTPTPPSTPDRARAAALWKILSADPSELLKTQERMGALESEVATRAQEAERVRLAKSALETQLAAHESSSVPDFVAYTLAAALAAALAALAWLAGRTRWQSQRQAQQAWQESVARQPAMPQGPEPAPALQRARAKVSGWGSRKRRPADVAVADGHPDGAGNASAAPGALYLNSLPSDWLGPSTVPQPIQGPDIFDVSAFRPPEFAASAALGAQDNAPPDHVPHIVNPEDLFDIQQQADFFVSVGEHDQAIQVLRQHIALHSDASPAAYLELLRLFHMLSRVDDFAQLRKQFQQHFNVRIPAFSLFSQQGHALESYPDALAVIEAEWTSSTVIALIEGYLLRKACPALPGAEPPVFDLAACDDLLMLLGVAQTTAPEDRGAPPPRQRTTPLSQAAPLLAEPGERAGEENVSEDVVELTQAPDELGPDMPNLSAPSERGGGFFDSEPSSLQRSAAAQQVAQWGERNALDIDLSESSLAELSRVVRAQAGQATPEQPLPELDVHLDKLALELEPLQDPPAR